MKKQLTAAQKRKQASGKVKAFYANQREIQKQNGKPYKRMVQELRAKKGLAPHPDYEDAV